MSGQTYVEYNDVIYRFVRIGYPESGGYYQDRGNPGVIRRCRTFVEGEPVRVFEKFLSKSKSPGEGHIKNHFQARRRYEQYR